MSGMISSDGRRLTLGPLLGQGGEGAVHEIIEAPNLAAKIYNPGKAKERHAKIEALVSARLHATSEYVAFPIETLKSANGDFLGFSMKKVAGFKSVHDLYGPASRKTEFPTADSKFLLRTAINLASAVANIHANGCVIGDINHSGILVSNKALVTLIDSDSFQYRSSSTLYRCLVGVAEYTPPELQGASFDKVDRTPNHDNFGLAVLLFQLLFLGRHPFAGRYLGKGDMDIKTAIRDGRFAYSERRAETQMEPPPYAPALADYGAEVGRAFEAAFRLSGRQLSARPTAADWAARLKTVEGNLATCATDKSHSYFRSLPSCPWCKLERSMGRSLFPVQYSPSAPVMDIGQLLAAIRAIPTPTVPPDPETIIGPLPTLTISAAGQAARSEKSVTVFAGVIAVAIGIYLMVAVQGFWGLALAVGAGIMTLRAKDLGLRFQGEHKSAQANWEEQRKVWLDQAGPEKFERRKSHYLSLANAHAALPTKEREKLAALEQKKRQLQLAKHMESHRIDRANIPNIGQGRKATLASYGFENAWDIQHRSVTSVPGFGPSLAGDLQAWARSIERKFVFNASVPTDPRAIQEVKGEIAKQRAEIERELANGPLELRRLSDEALALHKTPPQRLVDAYTRLKQVELDMMA
ncbi:helix-hairpin-helix domain-containing protein [Sinorhizobium terangae]|uniref:helix-hairpin-helix domain-containing protein n=1 Tax=Sinorhizobium terangae TaxID=110322 RepID=UPI0024B18947|nr:protein kinase domain-containing protein [Sinorhizobium terangae]WFU50726.1 protein kinase domain-containing protein [Sinorhizobium terangae]